MNVLIVHAHPEPESFNGAMTRTAVTALEAAGHSVTVSDLYADGFEAASNRHNFTGAADPARLKLQAEEMHATESGGFAADLEREMARLEAADLLIFQFPLWWFGLPAILKGWVDRTFAMGRIYGGGKMYDNGVFRGRRAMASVTTGAPTAAYTEGGMQGDIEAVLRPLHRGIFQFVGYDVLATQMVNAPVRMDDAEREAALGAWGERLGGVFEEAALDVTSFR